MGLSAGGRGDRSDDRRFRMARTGPGFVIGVLVGGFGGFAAGYLLSRNGHSDADHSIGSIDLTPAIELKNRALTSAEQPAKPEQAEEKPACSRRRQQLSL